MGIVVNLSQIYFKNAKKIKNPLILLVFLYLHYYSRVLRYRSNYKDRF